MHRLLVLLVIAILLTCWVYNYNYKTAVNCYDWLGGDKFTRVMKTWHFHVCITVSRQEYRDDVPFLHLIANNTSELVYDNAPECTILKWNNITIFWGGGIARFPVASPGWEGTPFPNPSPGARSPLLFWQVEHCMGLPISDPIPSRTVSKLSHINVLFKFWR